MFARTTFIITLTSFLIGSVVTAQLASHNTVRRAESAVTERQRVVAPAVRPIPAATDEVEENIDIYGNEITDAVARYKLDATGAPYELHSPQTEVPRLGPPKS